jgi:hypothetical protein
MTDWLAAAVVVGCLTAVMACLLVWIILIRLDALRQQATTLTAMALQSHARVRSLDKALRGDDAPSDAAVLEELERTR